MLDRIWKVHSRSNRHGAGSRPDSKHSGRQPLVEVLEGRQLLTASLAAIANVTVPAQLGYQQPLDGSGDTDPGQTYTATSSNPDIKVSVAQGQFWTVTVSHKPANTSDVTITNESMTFQLFGDLTPQTVARITTLTNDGYYTNGFPTQTPPVLPGQYIPRITSVASSGFSAIQGGSSSPTSTSSSSGITPIATEPVQQLAFTGQNQLAMANTGQPNSTDAQFFITNGVPSASTQQAFDFNYTIFGQLVSGQQTVTDLSNVAVQENSAGTEDSQPITPVVINSVALSSTNPNGVLHIDTTSATAGQTATITVTATDPTDDTTATQSFTVTVGAYNGPTDPVINFVPFANPVSASTSLNAPVTVQLAGKSGYPNSSTPGTLTYQLTSQPANGTISQFNATTGTLVYTPNNNFSGPDTFQYTVVGSGPQSAPNNIPSQPGTVTVTVTAAALTSIALSPTGPTVAKGLTQQFTATGTYTDGTTANLTSQVTWASGTASVATISNASGSQGLASTLATGTTVITASLGGVTSPGDTLTVAANTGAVHLIDNDVLVVTPLPRTDHGTDNIVISQQANSIVVYVNGVPDLTQPAANSLLQIIVFGGKASTDIQVDPSVSPTIPITLDGGHGGKNVIQAGAGPTREHGWFGHTLLIGGTGPDALIGRKGFVRFKPTTTTNLIYAGVIKPRFSHRTVAPSGTYYRFEKGRLVPVLTT